jgi:hypothetical protein
VALSTQSDQVFVRVIAEQAAGRNVMNLKSDPTPAMLAAPRVSLFSVVTASMSVHWMYLPTSALPVPPQPVAP